jgi:hypothetical protein
LWGLNKPNHQANLGATRIEQCYGVSNNEKSEQADMKILFVGLARTIWLFNLQLLNPRGISLQPVIDEIKRRYNFAKGPNNPLDFDEQKALAFKAGTFINPKGTPVLIAVSIYSDGLVADTASSSDDSTEFLVQLTGWMTNEYGLTLPSGIIKLYVSNMDVETDAPLTNLNPRMAEVLEVIDAQYRASHEIYRKFDFSGISVWTEDIGKPGAPVPFKFERKIQTPFSANHYFSQAPLKTKDHSELLDKLEEILKHPRR